MLSIFSTVRNAMGFGGYGPDIVAEPVGAASGGRSTPALEPRMARTLGETLKSAPDGDAGYSVNRRTLLRVGSVAAAGAGGLSLLSSTPAQAAAPLPPVSRSSSGKGAVFLSMDDAFVAMDVVRQLLDARGQKGTFFITPGLLNGSGKINDTHILAMVANGHEVGAHSQTHANLTAITQLERVIELEQPKSYLEKLTGVPVTSFAYPFGTASGGRNATTDVELYLRYERLFDTAQYNQTALHPRYAQAPTLIRRTGVDSASHQQCISMIREAAVRPVVASIYFHNLDTQYNPTTAQLTEILDLAQSLGVELLTASEAFGSNRMVANAGFENSGTDAYPWRWFKSGSAQLDIVSENPSAGLPGSRSLHLTAPVSSYSTVSQSVEVMPGTTYTYSFRARAVSGSTWGPKSSYGNVVALDYGQASIAGSEVRTAPIMAESTAWAKYSVDFTAPPACTNVLLGLVLDWPAAGGRVAFDHVWFGPKAMADLG